LCRSTESGGQRQRVDAFNGAAGSRVDTRVALQSGREQLSGGGRGERPIGAERDVTGLASASRVGRAAALDDSAVPSRSWRSHRGRRPGCGDRDSHPMTRIRYETSGVAEDEPYVGIAGPNSIAHQQAPRLRCPPRRYPATDLRPRRPCLRRTGVGTVGNRGDALRAGGTSRPDRADLITNVGYQQHHSAPRTPAAQAHCLLSGLPPTSARTTTGPAGGVRPPAAGSAGCPRRCP
jgi:hypothetical protein